MLVTRVTNAVAARPAMRAAQLRVVDGPDRGLEIDLPPIGVVIGSERSCDVVLTDSLYKLLERAGLRTTKTPEEDDEKS